MIINGHFRGGRHMANQYVTMIAFYGRQSSTKQALQCFVYEQSGEVPRHLSIVRFSREDKTLGEEIRLKLSLKTSTSLYGRIPTSVAADLLVQCVVKMQ